MAPPPILPGTRLNNRYQIVRVLGQGGFGIVYLAQTSSGQQVAIKQNTQTDQASRDQFKLEADLVRPLKHANLVHVEDYFTDASGAQFLVMDFVPGDDLLDMADKRTTPFDEKQVLQWGVLLCDVLAYLHSRTPPIIHRDLKPQNIKIEPKGRLVLVDFGIAKAYDPKQKTQRGARGATPGFSPLEQYGQSSAGTNAQTDIYALGATLYYLLTREMPEDAMERAQNPSLLDPCKFNHGVSTATAQAIIKATQVKPPDRYLSANEFKQALERALSGSKSALPPQPQPAPMPTQPGVACPRCRKINRAGARICNQCGSPLVSINAAGVWCPHCGANNRGSARMCASCGRPLAGPSLPQRAPLPPSHQPNLPMPPLGPTVQRGTTLAQDQATAAWSLFGVGVLGIAVAVVLISQALISPLPFFLIALGLFSILAGRDLNDLFSSSKSHAPDWLAFAFDSPNRGRRWGTMAATLWIIVGVALGWLVIPLALAAGMAYVLNILIGDAFVKHVGGHYSRPGWVTVIGWALVCSGIGTVPGIALLIPKPWAIPWSQRALGAIALAALGSGFIALINVASTTLPAPVSATLPGSPFHPWLLAIITLSVAALVGAIRAIQYLETVKLNFTQTAARRELNVAGWTLLATGGLVMLASLIELGRPVIGNFFWVGLLIGVLALSSARDILELGSRWLSVGTFWIGDLELGRRKGIVASIALATVSALLAWQIVPLAFLAVAVFILRVLMGAQAVLVCGGQLGAPVGVTLTAWLLIPSGIGTVPGILMLKTDARGWTLARFALIALGIAGLIGTLAAGANAMSNPGIDAPLTWTAATGSVAIALCAGIALSYIQSSAARRYFGI